MKKKVLITGTSGMLGGALVELWKEKFELYTIAGRDQFDFHADNYSFLKAFSHVDAIVHCAAITNVDYCEKNPEEAMLINGESVRKLILQFPKKKIVFISSDAVFSAKKKKNANESTPTRATTIYGKSKELGEKYIKNFQCGTIIRTTIVGKNMRRIGHSLAEWIVDSLKNGKKIALFNNVWFTPITVWQLADALGWVIENNTPKILHISGDEKVTKYRFGVELAKSLNLPTQLIIKKKMLDKSFVAQRAKDMSMSSDLYQKISGRKTPLLREVVADLANRFEY